ncbi:PREDICTED: serine/threonine-protein kinase VRK1-like [Dinoponera quadriceps]|uniref:non-specific serine/threonine protein kinase n=1 Tax=Dinoponera quadriceps TaxID=609295 RepID=A0A6P3WNT0_DINQU|nr:PREDICTED: serine/threonine-protein kinase VRK1-like [Dinoponera quadriceps]XP_014467700.1 PREDICTED: serine/threonine-protein kinase VRK1-like [Dinoponera quadriceps]XP_014467701.1 PREDICTED: serine/threonine-protein kinase VRK1-like [Dinoponera quadriceps]XP_014467702.1 PREDICTED: serine/threonine-protein kinase VRK1-like [Dinoponera quadriceps]XP_014467704.1 PREDICTED: serine/threonine-protein kinase VRK1-like [Dinoponera quadriceps]XP_014467705.1 PREDICTED: serine/threonine-protein kina
MPPRRVEDVPVKRVAAAGCKLPAQLPAGEILIDITQNKWKLGNTIGYGGFGDIYLASNDITSPVGEDAKYVVKIEPHNNGPLFVEMNFYIRAARRHMIESWCKSQGKRRIGVPTYEGSGSHVYRGQRYRFLIIPRYGIDIGKLFLSHRRKLPTKLVNTLAVQMLDALEYIHSKGYAHADIKGPNILLAGTYGDGIGREKSEAYLVDYGLAYRFRTGTGQHKSFVHDERRAHEGTLEYTSRDAHHGTHSRRGDLETLGYNIIQWLCGKLPWEKNSDEMGLLDPEEVHAQKEVLLSDLSLFMDKCFPDKKKPPAAILEYMKYITELEFETKPNYTYLRNLFIYGGSQDGNIPSYLYYMKESNENLTCSTFFERPYLRERKPCRPVNGEIRITRNTQPKRPTQRKEFSWEAVLALHPDKFAKINTQSPPSPLTPPPSPRPPSLPTYAMLDVIRRMKEKQSGTFRHSKSLPKSSDNELKAKWMTPAMEEIARLRKKSTDLFVSESNSESSTLRVTRSRVAKLKRLGTQEQRKRMQENPIDSTVTHKRRKGPSS